MAIHSLELERYLLDELPARRRTALAAQLVNDPVLAARLEALRRSNEEILERYPSPPRAFIDAAQRKATRRLRWRWFQTWSVAATCSLLLVVVVVRQSEPQAERLEGTVPRERVKGLAPQLVVYRNDGGSTSLLASGSLARPGDTLQVATKGLGRRYCLVFSVDGRGFMTIHFPEQGRRGAQLDAVGTGGEVALPHSFELDDAPEFERFFLVSSEQPFDLDPILSELRTAPTRTSLPLGSSFEQATFSIVKESP